MAMAAAIALAVAGTLWAQPQSSGGNAPMANPPRELDPGIVQEAKQQIGRLMAEHRRLRARHQALQQAVTRAATVLQRQGSEGAHEALATLEAALREEARAAKEAENERIGVTPADGSAAPAPTADGGNASSAPAPGSTPPAAPAASGTGDALTNGAGDGYFYGNVRFEQTPDGFACIGQIVNTKSETPSVATFQLTTLDAQGNTLETAKIYVGMPKPNQPRVFRVALTQKPPTGKFKLDHLASE
jgi:hypothetical protein